MRIFGYEYMVVFVRPGGSSIHDSALCVCGVIGCHFYYKINFIKSANKKFSLKKRELVLSGLLPKIALATFWPLVCVARWDLGS